MERFASPARAKPSWNVSSVRVTGASVIVCYILKGISFFAIKALLDPRISPTSFSLQVALFALAFVLVYAAKMFTAVRKIRLLKLAISQQLHPSVLKHFWHV